MTSPDLCERVRILKIKLSALRDQYVSDFLPGAPGIADEACAILDELVAELPHA